MPISTNSPTLSTPPSSQAWIGERIKMWRRNVGYTQTDLAQVLGVDKGTLRKYELGLMAPGALVLARACAQGVNINWVLTGELPMLKAAEPACHLPDSEDRLIVQLRDALCTLRVLDHPKFVLLTNGFTARAEEAAHMANLEKLVSVVPQLAVPAPLPPVEGNKDIIAYGAQANPPPPKVTEATLPDTHGSHGSESSEV